MRAWAGLCVLLVLWGSPAGARTPETAASSAQCLTYQRGDGGSPVIEAFVEGRGKPHGPFFLVLDTAASGTTLDERTIQDLGLQRDVQTETAQGMGGSRDVRLFRVPSLRAGPRVLRDFTVVEIPAPAFASHPVVGLAGVDLFGSTLAAWNGEDGCVTISSGGAAPAGRGWRRIDVRWVRPWKIMLPVRIGGVRGWGLLDTGSQHTVLNPAFARRLGLTEGAGRLDDGGALEGVDGRSLPLSRAEIGPVRVGLWRWKRRVLRVGDLPVFERLGDPATPLAVIGSDWLAGRSFAVDYGGERVWQRSSGERRKSPRSGRDGVQQ
ncbi:retroviral-like aspartic protease family protein [Caulobacter sp. BK020]|uniref:retroviral-like aspartic protease family protein n=1 Tax=Caulobacter sp. BK020 TaxID=2512117 RepID=UPI0010481B6B|nr:retroviral-like aspartic protease family protein [Caulobacter sp. BK020]